MMPLERGFLQIHKPTDRRVTAFFRSLPHDGRSHGVPRYRRLEQETVAQIAFVSQNMRDTLESAMPQSAKIAQIRDLPAERGRFGSQSRYFCDPLRNARAVRENQEDGVPRGSESRRCQDR